MAYSRFDRVPNHYAGPIIQRIKKFRRRVGRKRLTPTLLRIGPVEVLVPRHFGFCFGVERAIHMVFSAVEEHPEKRAFLVSEIIHNPLVNRELRERGIRFLFDEKGERVVAEDEIGPEDLVFIPAFGTTLQIEESLRKSGIDPDREEFRKKYDTTCPFVAKVWKRGEELGRQGYTIVIHGKFRHEETLATQSHTQRHAPTLVVLDQSEAEAVRDFITGRSSLEAFQRRFEGKWSEGFDPERDLERVAVINQTTMLAEETRKVAGILREAMRIRYGEENLSYHWADTSDTLCYATNQNQNATRSLLDADAALALIVGGYNSSNTSHLVEICSEAVPSYLISDAGEIVSRRRIRHFDIHRKERVITEGWLPEGLPVRLIVTSGASCPDVLMNQVIERIAGFYGLGSAEIEAGLRDLRLFDVKAPVS